MNDEMSMDVTEEEVVAPVMGGDDTDLEDEDLEDEDLGEDEDESEEEEELDEEVL